MSRRPGPLLVCSCLCLLASRPAPGQGPAAPILAGVFPPGATIGTTTEWAIEGRNLGKVRSLSVEGAGVEVLGFSVKDEKSATARVRVAGDAPPGYREVRVEGADGLSNLALIRVDALPGKSEVEPNDAADLAQEVAAGSVVAGSLTALDVDVFKVTGTPGARLTLDLEARRIGTSITPVVTVSSPSGASIVQGRESGGGDRDCRIGVTIPAEGWLIVQVRDNTYGGSNQARYRLRVDPAPFATAILPLGGPRGATVEVEVSGGNLPGPLRKAIRLPDAPGSFVEVGDVDGPTGPVHAPGRLLVGEGAEAVEPAELRAGVTVNGRLGRAGEVDSYRLAVKAGEKVRIGVEAAAMGSWLDSVLVVRDEKGAVVAENDDTTGAVRPSQTRSVSSVGVPEASPDSSVGFEARADGVVAVEVFDRAGGGGPEYGYRLATGPARPDFAITLLLGNSGLNLGETAANRPVRASPGQFGVYNLKPGAMVPLNFLISPIGRPGRVEVRAEGLPEGVSAEPVLVRIDGPRKPGLPPTGPDDAGPTADALSLRVARDARPGLSRFRIVATARPHPDLTLTREATATIGLDLAPISGNFATRVVSSFPLRVVGEARPRFVGPPPPPALRAVAVLGPLLLGDRVDLALEFTRPVEPDDGPTLVAKADGDGLETSLLIPPGMTADDGEPARGAVVRVAASPTMKPGRYPVRVAYTPEGGPTTTREATVEVREPAEVRPSAEAIFLRPGDSAPFPVEVRREAGFEGDVDLEFEGLPPGVKLAKAVGFAPGIAKAEAVLEMATTASPLAGDVELRIVGIARIAGKNVSIPARIRPMIRPRAADK